MDMSEYVGMFLAESREHLHNLNLAVIRIEESPDDRDTIDEIFRIAHSLKGMSATMGFAQMAALTHTMEDVFETLRGRSEALEHSVADVLLGCLDTLEGALDRIETSGEEGLDVTALVTRLGELVGEQTHAPAAAAEDAVAGEMPEIVRGYDGDTPLLCIEIELAPDVMMPAVRGYMTLAAIADHGEVIHSTPGSDDVDSFDGRRLEAWVVTEHEPATIEAAVRAVPDVGNVTIAVAHPAGAAPEPKPVTPARPSGAAAPAPHGRPATTVRVDAERLDRLMHYMGELVVHRTRVESLAAGSSVDGLSEAIGDLTRSSQSLQAMVMQVRMIEVEAVFMRFPRLIRDLSTKFGKRVELVMTGRDTELDRTVVDALGDPFVHLVRNSLDHALEPPEERLAAGKPATGTLELAARHAGSNVVLAVRDDGRGINPGLVARRAAERGLIPLDAVDAVDMARAVELVFTPGFSTVETTSDISGRGVGMDAVRTAIRGLGGDVVMTSEEGVGSTVQVRLPLTLAIVPALLVESHETPFAIPLGRVERTVSLAGQTVRSVIGRRTLVLGDGVLPLIDLAEALGYPPAPDAGYVVITRGAERRLALAVEGLVGRRELVTRPLPAEVHGASPLSGAAVLSSGEIALIVDCDALADACSGAANPDIELPTAA